VTEELIWDGGPELSRPVLVVAFAGWFDAAQAATTAVQWLEGHHRATRCAAIDPDGFFDFQQERPEIRLTDEGLRELAWPEPVFMAASTGVAHDLVLLATVEPHLRWPTYASLVTDVAQRVGCELVVTLGAVPSTVPHTRPFPVFGSTTTPALASRLGLQQPQYEGPTGIVGAVHDRLDAIGVPAIAARVSVPHYAAGLPSPKAAMALVAFLERVTGIPTGHGELGPAALEWEREVAEAVAGDEELSSYVPGLEAEHDRDADSLPSGDDLAAEFERFLREQRGDA
jgi:predicted ATP-grasp superfamily ATP-dependent carboligase